LGAIIVAIVSWFANYYTISEESRLDKAREAYTEFFSTIAEVAFQPSSVESREKFIAAKASVVIYGNVQVVEALAKIGPKPCEEEKFLDLVNEMRDHVGTKTVLPDSLARILCN